MPGSSRRAWAVRSRVSNPWSSRRGRAAPRAATPSSGPTCARTAATCLSNSRSPASTPIPGSWRATWAWGLTLPPAWPWRPSCARPRSAWTAPRTSSSGLARKTGASPTSTAPPAASWATPGTSCWAGASRRSTARARRRAGEPAANCCGARARTILKAATSAATAACSPRRCGPAWCCTKGGNTWWPSCATSARARPWRPSCDRPK